MEVKTTMSAHKSKQKKNWNTIHVTALELDTMKYIQQFLNNPHEFIKTYFDEPPRVSDIADMLHVSPASVDYKLIENDAKHLVQSDMSSMEIQVCDFIRRIKPGTIIINNDHQVIKPYELDIYIPEYKLAIECNPSWTHGSSENIFYKGYKKIPPGYHLNKTEMCEKAGVRLIHVFGHNWQHGSDIMKAIIRNALHANEYRINARDTKIRKVSRKQAFKFMSVNSIYKTPEGIYYALQYGDEIVCIMSFRRNKSKEDEYTINGFCSKVSTSVVGGASKILSEFRSRHPGCVLIANVNRALFTGDVWERLGFVHVANKNPEFSWIDVKSELCQSRKISKKSLIKLTGNSSCKNVDDMMKLEGFVKVYDCGQSVWRLE